MVASGLLVTGIAVVMIGVSGRNLQVEVLALPGSVLGVALALFGLAQGPIARTAHPWTWRYGVVVAVVSLVPAGAWVEGPHPVSAPGVMSFVIAGFIAVAAIDTHRALVRLLAVARPDDGGAASEGQR